MTIIEQYRGRRMVPCKKVYIGDDGPFKKFIPYYRQGILKACEGSVLINKKTKENYGDSLEILYTYVLGKDGYKAERQYLIDPEDVISCPKEK